jgi:hypothetical protein
MLGFSTTGSSIGGWDEMWILLFLPQKIGFQHLYFLVARIANLLQPFGAPMLS